MPDEALLHRAIEMHDWGFAAVEHDGPSAKIHPTPGQIHKSSRQPGIDPGGSWAQHLSFQTEKGTVEGQFPRCHLYSRMALWQSEKIVKSNRAFRFAAFY